MKPTIEILYKDQHYNIPNNWDAVTPEDFRYLVEAFGRMALGEVSPGEIRLRLLCRFMHWNLQKVKDDDSMATLLALSSQLTFLFRIDYGKDNDLLDDLSAEDREICSRIDPYHNKMPLARALRRLQYHYVPDLCFAGQKVPGINVGKNTYEGYRILHRDEVLTTSLTALQYLEAQQLLQRMDGIGEEQLQSQLTLLAAILYYPDKRYSSEGAHSFAQELEGLDMITLQSIMINFQAFTSFLFERTQFSLLTKIEGKTPALITTDGIDALYDLAKDGLGNVDDVEQINLITYLRLVRKKTIDAVRQMKDMDWDMAKISKESGLPVRIVEKIIKSKIK